MTCKSEGYFTDLMIPNSLLGSGYIMSLFMLTEMIFHESLYKQVPLSHIIVALQFLSVSPSSSNTTGTCIQAGHYQVRQNSSFWCFMGYRYLTITTLDASWLHTASDLRVRLQFHILPHLSGTSQQNPKSHKSHRAAKGGERSSINLFP